MYSEVFLAMNDSQMRELHPKRAAYMAMHFSPYSAGLSNPPSYLPENSILLLDDSMPVQNHDTETVVRQLTELVTRFSVKAVLLDFQNSPTEESEKMVTSILNALPCPVAVTEMYARQLQCLVFLSPTPVNMPLKDHLAPWLRQGIYLDIAPGALEIAVTETGSKASALPANHYPLPLEDSKLHCHYNVTVTEEKAVFTLSRTQADLEKLVQEAYSLGILGAVGLYQELFSSK